jgi:[FeFe] hydrogenase H-cluster maturation GTPase HydF
MVVSDEGLQDADRALIEEIKQLEIPFILVFNKTDIAEPREADIAYASRHNLHTCQVSAKHAQGITELKEMLVALAPDFLKQEKVLAGDLIYPGDVVLLIAPIDLAAPKGRLILPQVQVLREILDNDALGMIVKEREIEAAFERLGRHPDLVITDSQVVLKVAGDVPPEVKMTTFSILFARHKGDLDLLVQGANKLDELQNGDKVLIAETCSHNAQCDDIGRVKIPRWLTQYTGKQLDYEFVGGQDFPDDLEKFDLIIHCGGCMINPTTMMRRITEAHRRGVAITNYGVAISKLQGVLERALEPFDMD